MPPSPKRITEELWRERQQRRRPRADLGAQIDASLFDKQLQFDRDNARRKAAFCTRRAGKTDYVPKRLIKRAWATPESIRVFLAITRTRARELIWRPLEILNEKYSLGLDMNGTTATVRFPNHSELRLRGADDIREVGKGRGDKLHSVDIDEAQTFDQEVLRTMIDDVYGPTLEDVGGDMNVYGTPGVVCAGKWYQITHPNPHEREVGWSVHSWGVLDNPFMAHMKQRLPELKLERGWADDNPTYLREWCGQWVNDASALFYKFDGLRNAHNLKESQLVGPGWMHVLGWDIGLRDEMALVAWAFHKHKRELFEAFSWKRSGVTTDVVMEQVRKLEARGFNFVARVADTGGLGALVVEEVVKRENIYFEAAKKTEKGAHVNRFNDDLLTGVVRLMRGSPYAGELAVLPKDPDSPEDKWPVEDPRFPNHCADAGLYAWRRAMHYFAENEEKAPAPVGTAKWYEEEARRQQKREDDELNEAIRQRREERVAEMDEANLM